MEYSEEVKKLAYEMYSKDNEYIPNIWTKSGFLNFDPEAEKYCKSAIRRIRDMKVKKLNKILQNEKNES